jgi:transcriptional regulator with XRE-family HTH domain
VEELGDFLRARRSRLSPEDAGLPDRGERRRVAGLRREELAQLAGVSVGYYTRLEQGLSRNASDSVLTALARALRLDGDETAHLWVLARPKRPAARPRAKQERVRPGVHAMLSALGDVPAMLVGYRTDVLAWNPMAHALAFGHLPYDAPAHGDCRPNLVRLTFCDPHTRALYADWKAVAQDFVAYLRLASGQHGDDPKLASLIGDLSVASPEFTRLWARHTVRECNGGVRRFLHPLVGRLDLNEEVMVLARDRGQRLVIFSAEPGTPAQDGLRLLASLTAEVEHDPRSGKSCTPCARVS